MDISRKTARHGIAAGNRNLMHLATGYLDISHDAANKSTRRKGAWIVFTDGKQLFDKLPGTFDAKYFQNKIKQATDQAPKQSNKFVH